MSQHPLLKEIESAFRRTDVPDFRSGDSVRVHTLIKEGDKERVQIFAHRPEEPRAFEHDRHADDAEGDHEVEKRSRARL